MRGKIGRSSTLRANGITQPRLLDDNPLASSETSITVGGEVDLSVYSHSSTYMRLGKEFFGQCVTKFQQTRPMTMSIRTKAELAASITVTDIRILRLYPHQIPDRPQV